MIQTERRLYTRYEHGNLPVDVNEIIQGDWVRRKLSLHLPDGAKMEFLNQGSFNEYLYGVSRKGISFARYFKLEDGEPLIALAGVEDVLAYCPPVVLGVRGIDLENRGIEVRRILYARFGRKIVGMGFDPEDVLQEVYRKLLVANQGNHPYDPSKSSFGHYVFMVCDSALRNYRKKEDRRRRKLGSGIAVYEDDRRVILDVGEAADRIPQSGDLVLSPESELAGKKAVRSLCEMIGSGTDQQDLACRIVVAFHEGATKRELSRRLGAPYKEIREALELVQESANYWNEDEGITT